MKLCATILLLLASLHCSFAAPFSTNGNRLAYLDSDDPFYPHRDFPKLITPQWVGEEGVEAVVILSIDDMRETARYEAFLRPILERLKKIDGRAPVSIMANAPAAGRSFSDTNSPDGKQIQSWLKEGLSIECHTISHPCPLCQKGDFQFAATNYHACVDLLNTIPGNKPVAFRMPCCDSMNSPSPRFYSEIFNRTSPQENFLGIDSSVMVVLTTNDTSLPRELVLDADGRERFRKYLPGDQRAASVPLASPPNRQQDAGGTLPRVSMGSFTTTIEDYPYPYIIGKTCWEFPAIVPSDWEANNLHAPNNPKTVEDWQRALDAIVIKQGVMTVVFHPHGWIKPEQMVEFIDYAATKYGKRVKFLNFKEAQERLNKNFLNGEVLRQYGFGDPKRRVYEERFADCLERILFTENPTEAVASFVAWQREELGKDVGMRVLDFNNDGYMDVFHGQVDERSFTQTWVPERKAWMSNSFELHYMIGDPLGNRFAILNRNGVAAFLWPGDSMGAQFGEFQTTGWVRAVSSTFHSPKDLPIHSGGFMSVRDNGVRFRDLDHDGVGEMIVGTPKLSAVFKYNSNSNAWLELSYTLPPGTSIVDSEGRDAGLRFVDVDGDGYDDILFSNHERYSLHLFRKDSRDLRLKPGWSDEIISGLRSNAITDPIPPIVRGPGSAGFQPASSSNDGTATRRQDAGAPGNNGVWFARSTMWIQNEDTAHLPDKVDRRTFKQLLELGNPPPLSPEASLKTMRARPGFKVELVASEPLIQDPIAFDWSADGRLWVLEMGDYPLGVDGQGSPGGRLRVLTDIDGDGRYDSAVTFLDKLSCPEGMHCWRNGAVVIAGKDLFYAEDTNGDGAADVREVLFTGFSEGNQQHRANGFTYGLDGWLYGANGESDGMVRAAGAPSIARPEASTSPLVPSDARRSNPTINIRGQDFRFDPDRRHFEAIGGRTQFGLYRDDFGNWFGNNNSTWLWHHFFPVPYLSRNPLLPLKTTKRTLANYPDFTRCFPISKTLSRFNDPHTFNHVTSGNSPVPYRDELFGKDFATSIFISEPVHNLVHREVLEPDGVSFKSHRAADETNSEFLASSDNWFRPTMLATGPDGALYVADMYRLVIEHPEWIPAEMQKRLDLRAGADKGRIYRVLPEGVTRRKIPNLAKMNSAELAAALDSPNGWQRDTAQRLLLERGDKSVVSAVEHHAKSAKDAKVRIQALWTLNGLNVLTPEMLRAALSDSSDAVREQGVKLSESFVRSGAPISKSARSSAEQRADLEIGAPIADALLAFSASATPRLRYQLAFTLGEWNDPRAADALLKLLHDDDVNIRNAALSSAPRHAKTLLALLEKLPTDDRARTHLPMLQKLVANPPASAAPVQLINRTVTLTVEQRAERAKVLARYADVPKLRGEAKNGAALFKQHCAQCHRLKGEGTEVGPDLGMMSGKPVEQLVEAILNPNAALEARYQNFSATLKDGHETGGIIVSETPTTLTLRAPNRADETLLRGDLKELSTSGLSIMPEGLEAAFTPPQLADLIAFVTGR